MGLYQDIQDDISEAFDEELSDVTQIIGVTRLIGDPGYDPSTGNVTQPKLVHKMRAVMLDSVTGEIIDNPALTDSATFLILDSEKTIDEFKVGLKVTTFDKTEFKIGGIRIDPAKAAWSLQTRRWA